MRNPLARLIALVSLVALAGCYSGVAAIVVAVGELDGGGGGSQRTVSIEAFVLEEDLRSGVVPLHLRVFDSREEPADLEILVDLGNGEPFAANEFPTRASAGRLGVDSIDPSRSSRTDLPVHTFLWDAVSQVGGNRSVALVIRVVGVPEADEVVVELPRIASPGLGEGVEISVGAFPEKLASEDFDGDGVLDLVSVGNDESDSISVLKGTLDGLSEAASLPVGVRPLAALGGRFNDDPFGDLIVSSRHPVFIESEGRFAYVLVYLEGSEAGLERISEIAVGEFPVALFSSDFNGDGRADVVVANELSDSVTLVTGGVTGLREPLAVTTLPVGKAPVAVAAGDFNGDRIVDLAAVARDSDGVHVLLGGASGLSPASEPLAVGRAPLAAVSGDFDGDGFDDLAVANSAGGTVSYLRGTAAAGTVGLERVRDIAVDGEGRGFPRALLVGSYDADGAFDDVVLVNRDSGTLLLLHGGEKGLEDPELIALLGDESAPVDVVSADFDDDGFPDLAVANGGTGILEGPGTVSLFRGDGVRFRLQGEVVVGSVPLAVRAGDFNDDGVPDLVVAGYNSSTVTYLPGDPDRGLASREQLASGSRPGGVASGDFNADGIADVAVANSGFASPGASGLTYYEGGIEGLAFARSLEAGDFPRTLVVADCNGDGIDDVVVANESSDDIDCFFGAAGSGGGLSDASGRRQTLPGSDLPSSLVVGNFDGREEFPDIAVAHARSAVILVLAGGLQGLSTAQEIDLGAIDASLALPPTAIEGGDFSGDGVDDLLVALGNAGVVLVFLGVPQADAGPLVLAGSVPLSGSPSDLAAGDFDGDGGLDAVVAIGSSRALALCQWDSGAGRFQQTEPDRSIPLSPSRLTPGDFDGDGILDVAVVSENTERLLLVRRLSARFPAVDEDPSARIQLGGSPAGEYRGDFNGDGFADLLILNSGSDDLTFLRGGTGGLRRDSGQEVGNEPVAAAAGDYDGDGFVDVVVANRRSNDLTYLEQRYFTLHASRVVTPQADADLHLRDPRPLSAYALAATGVGSDSFGERRQVCLIPGASVHLRQPPPEGGSCVIAVTDTLTVLPDDVILQNDGTTVVLTLAVRSEHVAEVRSDPSRLIVFRRDESSRRVEPTGALPRLDDRGDLDLHVVFEIDAFGSYVVAREELVP